MEVPLRTRIKLVGIAKRVFALFGLLAMIVTNPYLIGSDELQGLYYRAYYSMWYDPFTRWSCFDRYER